MDRTAFATRGGMVVPAVTADEMREVDRVAVEDVGLDLVRMMEHAGRGLAGVVIDRIDTDGGRGDVSVTVLAGNGGNGGGGLAAARHLANRDYEVRVALDRDPEAVDGVTADQLRILDAMDVPITATAEPTLDGVVVDALIGYGLTDSPRGRAAELIAATADAAGPIVSLDIPSGVDATTGGRPGVAVDPDSTATLALPKTGLTAVDGDYRLIDLSIPDAVYDRASLRHDRPFGDRFSVRIAAADDG